VAVIQRGDIRWFRFDHPDKRRPVLVLGRDDLLSAWSLIPVIPLSTQIRGLAWEVELTPDDGVPTACVLKPEWIKAVDRVRLGPRIATLPESRWSDIRVATLHVLGFDGH
jgi:mRNA-degrading endonuclease toxin of MazEF toxin-antitoxin module